MLSLFILPMIIGSLYWLLHKMQGKIGDHVPVAPVHHLSDTLSKPIRLKLPMTFLIQ